MAVVPAGAVMRASCIWLAFGLAAGCSCGNGPPGAPEGTAAADGSDMEAGPDAASDALEELALGDPGWVAWLPSECPGIDVSRAPAYAAPELIWQDCPGGTPGCRHLKVTWSFNPAYAYPFQGADVSIVDGAVRFSIYMNTDAGWLTPTYDETDAPVAAWRGWYDNVSPCGGGDLCWTRAFTGFVFMRTLAGGYKRPAVHTALSPLEGQLVSSWGSQGGILMGCSEHLLAAIDLVGNGYVRDMSSGQEYPILSDGSVFTLFPVADGAIVQRMGSTAGHQVLEPWIWHPPDSIQRLINPGDELVFDIRADATTLAWLQMPTESVYDIAGGALWASPFTTNPAEVAPKKIRDVPPTTSSTGYHVQGGGYYALVEGSMSASMSNSLTKVHVYRLSDGRHWEVPNPPQTRSLSLFHIDSDELWFMRELSEPPWRTIARQRLDALGSGD